MTDSDSTQQHVGVGLVKEEHMVDSKELSITDNSDEKYDVERNARAESAGKIKIDFKTFMAIFSLGGLLTASQIPLYLVGGGIYYIYTDIGGASTYAWLSIANALAIAAIAPFVGAVSDLCGRRYICIAACLFIIAGCAVLGTAQTMPVAIGGMAIEGVGAALGELTAVAAVGELAPVHHRGYYTSAIFSLIFPFCLNTMYAQLYGANSTWRWSAWISIGYTIVVLIMLVLFYNPPPRKAIQELSKKEILKRIDYLGGVLSIAGFCLFLLAIQEGGYTKPWGSARVISCLVVGIVLIIAFIVWENFAPYPMVPGHLFKNKRISVLTFIVTAISGANFYSLLNFWPLQLKNVFNPSPALIGAYAMPFGFSVAFGVVVVTALLSKLKGSNRELLFVSCVLMTAGVGSLSGVGTSHKAMGIVMSFIGGFGVGGIIIPAAVILTIVSPDENIALITAVTISIRLIGGAIGYAIYFNVLQKRVKNVLPTHIAENVVVAGLPLTEVLTFVEAYATGDMAALAKIPGLTPAILEAARFGVSQAYAYGFKILYLVSIAFGGTAIICSVFLGDVKAFMSDHVAVHL